MTAMIFAPSPKSTSASIGAAAWRPSAAMRTGPVSRTPCTASDDSANMARIAAVPSRGGPSTGSRTTASGA